MNTMKPWRKLKAYWRKGSPLTLQSKSNTPSRGITRRWVTRVIFRRAKLALVWRIWSLKKSPCPTMPRRSLKYCSLSKDCWGKPSVECSFRTRVWLISRFHSESGKTTWKIVLRMNNVRRKGKPSQPCLSKVKGANWSAATATTFLLGVCYPWDAKWWNAGTLNLYSNSSEDSLYHQIFWNICLLLSSIWRTEVLTLQTKNHRRHCFLWWKIRICEGQRSICRNVYRKGTLANRCDYGRDSREISAGKHFFV